MIQIIPSFGLSAGNFLVVLIAIDRWLAINRPTYYATKSVHRYIMVREVKIAKTHLFLECYFTVAHHFDLHLRFRFVHNRVFTLRREVSRVLLYGNESLLENWPPLIFQQLARTMRVLIRNPIFIGIPIKITRIFLSKWPIPYWNSNDYWKIERRAQDPHWKMRGFICSCYWNSGNFSNKKTLGVSVSKLIF